MGAVFGGQSAETDIISEAVSKARQEERELCLGEVRRELEEAKRQGHGTAVMFLEYAIKHILELGK